VNQVFDYENVSYTKRILEALRIDPVLLLLLGLLSVFGVMLLYSASGSDIDLMMRQITRLAMAFLLMVAFANIPMRILKNISAWLYLAGILLLLAVMLYGEVGKGAQRWLDLGIIRFQPKFLAKYREDKIGRALWNKIEL